MFFFRICLILKQDLFWFQNGLFFIIMFSENFLSIIVLFFHGVSFLKLHICFEEKQDLFWFQDGLFFIIMFSENLLVVIFCSDRFFIFEKNWTYFGHKVGYFRDYFCDFFSW